MRSSMVMAAAVLVVVLAGCGESDSGGGGGEGSSSADVVSATLGIITTNIDTDTGEGFSDATEGEELTVGDRVRTDDTGFAEVTYHDGSWMRVESAATLTIEDLTDTSDGQVVSTSIDTGEAWSRVVELSEPEDEFVVDTPVASAAVRGTAFAIDCEGDTSCTFSVVEGEVLITPDTGDPVTLTAGQSLTVTAGEEPPSPEEPGVEALSSEPFIAENLELDETKAAETDGGEDEGGEDEGAAADESGEGVYTGTATLVANDGTVGSLNPDNPQVGSTQAAAFSLRGDCDGSGSCTFSSRPVGPSEMGGLPVIPPIEMSAQDGRYAASQTEQLGDCSIVVTESIEVTIDGRTVSGTFSSEPDALRGTSGSGGSCFVNRTVFDFEGARE